jgi:hypothetical protein
MAAILMKSRLLLWKTGWFGEEFLELGTVLPNVVVFSELTA